MKFLYFLVLSLFLTAGLATIKPKLELKDLSGIWFNENGENFTVSDVQYRSRRTKRQFVEVEMKGQKKTLITQTKDDFNWSEMTASKENVTKNSNLNEIVWTSSNPENKKQVWTKENPKESKFVKGLKKYGPTIAAITGGVALTSAGVYKTKQWYDAEKLKEIETNNDIKNFINFNFDEIHNQNEKEERIKEFKKMRQEKQNIEEHKNKEKMKEDLEPSRIKKTMIGLKNYITSSMKMPNKKSVTNRLEENFDNENNNNGLNTSLYDENDNKHSDAIFYGENENNDFSIENKEHGNYVELK